MSLAEIKKTIQDRIQELDSRTPLKEYDKGRLFQLEWFLKMIELEEQKILERIKEVELIRDKAMKEYNSESYRSAAILVNELRGVIGK